MLSEKISYHAAVLAAGGHWRLLRERFQSLQSWHSVWASLASDHSELNPATAYSRLEPLGIKLVLLGDPDYPPLLAAIPDPPLGLYWRGSLPPKSGLIAVVGTRRATPVGKLIAHDLSVSLTAAGLGIISGLAFGIDAAAHRGALAARGRTWAILASGLDLIYPAAHQSLATDIIKSGGGLLSEYPPGFEPLPYRFLERNRLTSGLSSGVVIVEAPEKSGALATAGFAAEQGREVFVTPGDARHPNWQGSHRLLRDGARLITGAADLLLDLGLDSPSPVAAPPADLSSAAQLIIAALKLQNQPLTVDKLFELTKLNVQTLNQTLADLVINGLVKETSGRHYL